LWGYVLVIGTVIVGGFVGLSYILQGLGNRAAQAASNPLEIAVIEKAYESVPSAIVTAIVTPLQASLERSDKALQDVLKLLEKATDRVPESEKTINIPASSTLTTPVGYEARPPAPPDVNTPQG
ncbi:hypothetical protein, partial [Corallococcus exercitus]|uniref:hypothetical protein n=1 Tax=Corallococcus exercitus TaxID=2316736 RepID=UPI0013156A91